MGQNSKLQFALVNADNWGFNAIQTNVKISHVTTGDIVTNSVTDDFAFDMRDFIIRLNCIESPFICKLQL